MRLPNKRYVADQLKKAPWAIAIAQMVFRVLQPWVTVGVVGALFDSDGKVLIVEHVFHPKFPWGLPGGWMNRGEEPENTIRREMLEETGLHITVKKPLLIARTKFMAAHLDIAFLCHLPMSQTGTDDIHLSSELLAYQWIDPQNPPPMAYFHRRVLRAALAEMGSGDAEYAGETLHVPEPMIEDQA